MDFKPEIIGRSVRLPHWTDCAVIVEDVGLHSFWGRLIIIKTGHGVKCPDDIYVGTYEEAWELVFEAEDVLDVL